MEIMRSTLLEKSSRGRTTPQVKAFGEGVCFYIQGWSCRTDAQSNEAEGMIDTVETLAAK